MANKFTEDHEKIQEWIESHNGEPAIEMNVIEGRPRLMIAFDADTKARKITWNEFFDIFDSLGMAFRYNDAGNEPDSFSYGFIDKSEDPDVYDNLNELPESNEIAEENMNPSNQGPEDQW